MKEEQAKALFFAQYLRQKCGVFPDNIFSYSITGAFLDKYVENGFLLLRSIDNLDNAEILTIAYIYDSNCEWVIKDRSDNVCILESVVERMWVWLVYAEPIFEVSDIKDESSNSTYNILSAYDYLRSIGILLPFTYLNEDNKPITLTTEQIIEKGWAKVK